MDDEFTLIPLSSLDRIQKQNFEIIRKTVVTRVCTTATVCSKKKHLIHQCFSIFTPLAIFLTDHRQPQAEDHGHAVCSHPARHSPTNPGSERRISIDILQLRMKLGITLAIPNLLISSPKKEKNLLKTLALSHKSKKYTTRKLQDPPLLDHHSRSPADSPRPRFHQVLPNVHGIPWTQHLQPKRQISEIFWG